MGVVPPQSRTDPAPTATAASVTAPTAATTTTLPGIAEPEWQTVKFSISPRDAVRLNALRRDRGLKSMAELYRLVFNAGLRALEG